MNGQKRILKIFIQLLNGETLTKKELMEKYGKQGSSIQRDIKIIEEVLEENNNSAMCMTNLGTLSRKAKGSYQLPDFFEMKFLTDDELLATLKILFASRAFNSHEITILTNKFYDVATDKKRIRHFIANEELYYKGVSKVNLLDRINLICKAISENKMVEFEYTKNGETRTFRKLPNALHFADLYFFMFSASHTAQDDADFEELNKFRINNMVNLKIVPFKNKIPYSDRFESSILRNHTGALPFLGKPLTLILDFYLDPIYVLDRFPDSKLIKENEDGSFRLEVLANDGYGVKMWLLSQGDMVKVISPQHIKKYIIQDMKDALKYYGLDVVPQKDS